MGHEMSKLRRTMRCVRVVFLLKWLGRRPITTARHTQCESHNLPPLDCSRRLGKATHLDANAQITKDPLKSVDNTYVMASGKYGNCCLPR